MKNQCKTIGLLCCPSVHLLLYYSAIDLEFKIKCEN